MALRVMLLDMRELSRLAKSRNVPVQIPHPLVKGRVSAANVSDVALEVLDVDGIEADDGRVEADVCFGDTVAIVVWTGRLGEVLFSSVERGEECCYGFDVGVLRPMFLVSADERSAD